MIVVRVELWPHGMQHRSREIAQVMISNVGGDDDHGDYECEASVFEPFWHHRASFKGQARKGVAAVLTLLARALNEMGLA